MEGVRWKDISSKDDILLFEIRFIHFVESGMPYRCYVSSLNKNMCIDSIPALLS